MMKRLDGRCNHYLNRWTPANPGVVHTCSHRVPRNQHYLAWGPWNMFFLSLLAWIWIDLFQNRHRDARPANKWVNRYLGFLCFVMNAVVIENRDTGCLMDMHCTGQYWAFDVFMHLAPLILWLSIALLMSWHCDLLVMRLGLWVHNGGWTTRAGLRYSAYRMCFWVTMAASVTSCARLFYHVSMSDTPYTLELVALFFSNPFLVHAGFFHFERWQSSKEEVKDSAPEKGLEDIKEAAFPV